MGEGMFGANDDRREGVGGASPRREVVEDFLTRAGDDDRFMLMTLELRRRLLAGKLGEEGVRRSSAGFLGDRRPGDNGSGVAAAV